MKGSCASRGRSAAGFFVLFVSVALAGLVWAEWILREHVFNDDHAQGPILVAKRVAAIYEPRVWPLMGDSRVGNVLVGDSQIYAGFTNHHAGFFQLGLWAETAPMLEILVKEYFRFRTPGRAIIEAGPQLFAPDQINNGFRKHDTYFKQNNWLQHRLGVRSFVAEPGIGSFIDEAIAPTLAAYARLIGGARADEPAGAARGREPAPAAEAALGGEEAPPAIPRHWGDYPAHGRIKMARDRVTVQRPVAGFAGTSHYAAYERALAYLAERGARICILRIPVTAEYLKAAKDDVLFAQAYDAFRALGNRYGRYVDFLDLGISWKPEHFGNQDHLVETGVAIFAPRAMQACFSE